MIPGRHPHYIWEDLFRGKRDPSHLSIEILKENILFCTLSPRQLHYLSTLLYERVYQPQEVIFRQNDRGFGMYFIAKGKVAIQTHSSEGDILLTELTAGSFFGELSLVEPQNIRTATAVALEHSVLIGFFKPDFMEILDRKPEMAVKILFQLSLVLGKRLVETTARVSLLSKAKVVSRIHGDTF